MVVLQQTQGNMTIYIETSDVEPSLVSTTDDDEGRTAGLNPSKSVDKLKELGMVIGNTCRSLYENMKTELAELSPNEFALEFGVKLAGKAGIPMVTEGSAEATVKVTAKWTKK